MSTKNERGRDDGVCVAAYLGAVAGQVPRTPDDVDIETRMECCLSAPLVVRGLVL